MKIKIYQIDSNKDNGKLKFLNCERTIKRTGGMIASDRYRCVYSGEVDCKGLEDVYRKFNVDKPDSFKGHSMSVSDVVEVVESDEIKSGFYFCDSIGFKKVGFKTERTAPEQERSVINE